MFHKPKAVGWLQGSIPQVYCSALPQVIFQELLLTWACAFQSSYARTTRYDQLTSKPQTFPKQSWYLALKLEIIISLVFTWTCLSSHQKLSLNDKNEHKDFPSHFFWKKKFMNEAFSENFIAYCFPWFIGLSMRGHESVWKEIKKLSHWMGLSFPTGTLYATTWLFSLSCLDSENMISKEWSFSIEWLLKKEQKLHFAWVEKTSIWFRWLT